MTTQDILKSIALELSIDYPIINRFGGFYQLDLSDINPKFLLRISGEKIELYKGDYGKPAIELSLHDPKSITDIIANLRGINGPD